MFLKQQLILAKFNRPCNFKGVAGFNKLTELPQYECRIKTPTSSTFSFNRLPTQMIKYVGFLWDFDVCGNNKERPGLKKIN